MSGEDGSEPRVFSVLRGEALRTRSGPFGEVGTLCSAGGIEVAWVSKHGEQVDPDWFRPDQVDVLLVVQGQLKVEFESAAWPDRVLAAGDVLVLPAGCRCRAYRWPRDAAEATIFLAACPAGQDGR